MDEHGALKASATISVSDEDFQTNHCHFNEFKPDLLVKCPEDSVHVFFLRNETHYSSLHDTVCGWCQISGTNLCCDADTTARFMFSIANWANKRLFYISETLRWQKDSFCSIHSDNFCSMPFKNASCQLYCDVRWQTSLRSCRFSHTLELIFDELALNIFPQN